jgi:hypothetical protein
VLAVSAALYYGPRARTGKGRGQQGSGLYPELAALGFSDGDSAAWVSTVARPCVLLPSFEQARQELARHGLHLDIKAVHRVARRLSAQVLTTRRRQLLAWRNGQVLPGKDLAGKRVGVAIDGGRIRLRRVTRKQKGKQAQKTQRRRYQAPWREPKMLIIFEMDSQGRMVRGHRPWIDGTFAGPDALMELLAFHLHRLGASEAAVVTFLSDGAPWIWERLAWVRQRAGLTADQAVLLLDWCHAAQSIGEAVALVEVAEGERRRLYQKMRKWLLGGWWGQVVNELQRLGEKQGCGEAMATAVTYLSKHGQAGHLKYAAARKRGLPIGSGAIESAIRRVINLRLKGNGLMWQEAHAEGMLLLRAAALTQRWDDIVNQTLEEMHKDGRLQWRWVAPNIPEDLARTNPITPPKPQVIENQQERCRVA